MPSSLMEEESQSAPPAPLDGSVADDVGPPSAVAVVDGSAAAAATTTTAAAGVVVDATVEVRAMYNRLLQLPQFNLKTPLEWDIAAVVQQPQPTITSSAPTASTATICCCARLLPHQLPLLAHYRQVPWIAQQQYEMLRRAATAVQSTSLKYALLRGAMAKASTTTHTAAAAASPPLTHNNHNNKTTALTDAMNAFVPDCKQLEVACMMLHEDRLGCAWNTRKMVRNTVLAILAAVLRQLDIAPDDGLASSNDHGPKAGAVEEACKYITDKKLPIGNRNAMRRDIFTYVLECRSTTIEFQTLIDQSQPSSSSTDAETTETTNTPDGHNSNNDTNTHTSTTSTQEATTLPDVNGDHYMDDGMEDRYTALELPIATAGVAILLCSRWCLNAALVALDAVGDAAAAAVSSAAAVPSTTSDASSSTTTSSSPLSHWVWMSKLHHLATISGLGVTDLGVSLYPRLELDNVQSEVERQTNAIMAVVEHILTGTTTTTTTTTTNATATTTTTTSGGVDEASVTTILPWELPIDVKDVALKVQRAIPTHKQQAFAAIQAAAAATSSS